MKKSVLDYLLKIRLPITLFVIIVSLALTYYVARPERDGVGNAPQQPINFSHKLHAGTMAIDCEYCHTSASKTRHASIPATNICMNCHTVAKKNSDEIKKLTEYYEQNKPVPWVRIHRVPEYAYFNHSVHVNKGIDCQECHGDVAKMETLEQVESFTMGSCLTCHRSAHDRFPELKDKINTGPENCNACHR